jgi:hypothetical protein
MKRIKRLMITVLVLAVLFAAGIWLFVEYAQFGFAREVELREQELREEIVTTAQRWVGTKEGDPKHAEILEIYNTHEPLAENYVVQPEDNWCATFCSAVAVECNLTDIIPTECGCERQIGLWMELGNWEEKDDYLPLPGDFIYYAWDEKFSLDDCTGWADHVGIVVGTAGPFIKVIEGNWADSVTYRVIFQNHWQIRGYGLPDYASKAE